MIERLALASLGAVLLALGPSCARLPLFAKTAAPTPEPASADLNTTDENTESLAFPFTLSAPDDYVVRIVIGTVTCTGALIERDRVLTAHHCVSARSASGEMLPRNVEPSSIKIELGGDELPWSEIGVRALVAPTCGYAAGPGDIAVLVLDRRLSGIATRAPRLDGPPLLKELIEPIGFGHCALSGDGVHRRKRPLAAIDTIADNRFRADAAICPGDSGGPVVSDSGEILGVISAAVMDADEKTRGRAEFTRLDHFRAVFAHAEAIARGESPATLPPIDCAARAE